MANNVKKEKFYNDSKVFFENELLSELYTSDNICICNLANQCYGVFPYLDSKDGQVCLLVTSEEVMHLINDNHFINHIVSKLDNEVLTRRTIALNQKTFELMKDMKMRNDINGPTSDIDLQMEEELLKKNKSR